MIKTMLTLTLLLLLNVIMLGQPTLSEGGSFLTVSVSAKNIIKTGDTITVRIKNLSSTNRGFTIEALSLSKAPEYESSVYSAFFNADSSFFQKLERSQALSTSENIGYSLPDYQLYPYEIEGRTEKVLTFVFKGKAMQKSVRLKLRITTDIIEDKSETGYSRPMTVLASPN